MKDYYDKFPLSGKLTRLRRLRFKPHFAKASRGRQSLLRKRGLASIIKPDFFAKNTLWVARNLLGKYLCRRLKSGRVVSAMITETEAYKGFNDKASHAHKGRTKRTEVMFGEPGTIYVYLIYGMYYCLNLVCEKKDYPAAVLIRRVEGVSGPGRVCKHFKIDRRINGQKLGRELWIEDKSKIDPDAHRGRDSDLKRRRIHASRRIGVDYAGKSKDWLWRFVLDEMV